MPDTPPVLIYPLFQGPAHFDAEEKRTARDILRKHSNNPGVRALFNLIERATFRLQADAIQPESGPHQQGQAYGALYTYGLARAWLEGLEDEIEEEDEE
jgi:hypothetical protein